MRSRSGAQDALWAADPDLRKEEKNLNAKAEP